MHRLLPAVLGAALAFAAPAATQGTYENLGVVTNPPAIDATNFVNRGIFSFGTFYPFDFSNVRNYTNRGAMTNFLSGFRFDTAPSGTGVRRPAVSFHNAPVAGNPTLNGSIYAETHLLVQATNINNKGILSVGEYGLLSLEGRNVDASRGIYTVGTFTDRQSLLPEAVFDSAWGFGNSTFLPNANIATPIPRTGIYNYTQFLPNFPLSPYVPTVGALFGFAAEPEEITGRQWIRQAGTNRSVQIVFLRNPNPNIATRVLSAPNPAPQLAAHALGIPIIEWMAIGTNAFGQEFENFLYLTDTFGVDATNGLATNYPFASPPPQSTPIPPATFQPDNFNITRTPPLRLLVAEEGEEFVDPDPDFWTTNDLPEFVTAQYSAYDARIATTTTDPLQVTNVRIGPGRISLKATGSLNLNLARIEGLNYLAVEATNHFVGATNASILSTFMDVRLGSTNGQLHTTGILKSDLPRFNGTINCYSAKWTNVVIFDNDGESVTNNVRFHVLFVDSDLQEFAQPQVFAFSLRSTNASVGDTFRVNDTINFDVENLTVLSNGVIQCLNPNLVWADGTTRIRNLTNHGVLDFTGSLNEVAYLGRHSNGTTRPYANFVNRGQSLAMGHRIVATNVVNSGEITSVVGPILITALANLRLEEPGALQAPNADISLFCNNLFLTNGLPAPQLGRTLNLAITNGLYAGPSYWEVLEGFNLYRKPVVGDLLETVIYDNAFPYAEVEHVWAGLDRGTNLTGFTNNAALGQLILDGGPFSLFTFRGTGPSSNALYVDVLLLQNDAAERDANGNLVALSCEPGMKIYFGQVFANGVDITAEMDGKNGGALRYVPHVGPLTLLRPQFRPEDVDLRVAVREAPQPRVEVSWNSLAGAINRLYALDMPGGGNWVKVTNFVSKSTGRVTYQQPPGATGRFFRVTVTPP